MIPFHDLSVSRGEPFVTQEVYIRPAAIALVWALIASSIVAVPQEAQHAAVNQPSAEKTHDNPKDGLKYVWIPPGTFMMGCSPGDLECNRSEKPPHQVTITKGFWMGQTEVTVAAYQRFAHATNRQMPPAPVFNSGWADQNMPITNVSWEEANDFCTWTGGRLPTEAEWEYAARGGDPHARYGNLDEVAWYAKNSDGRTHDVAQKQANGYGLYDTLGNVWEWVNDWFDDKYYEHSPTQDPKGPTTGEYRVLRGGAWFYFPRFVRVSMRVRFYPEGRVGNYGIRCLEEAHLPQ